MVVINSSEYIKYNDTTVKNALDNINSNFKTLNLNLDCTYGTIINAYGYRCGNLVTLNIVVNITTAVPSNTAFIGNFPLPMLLPYIGCPDALSLESAAGKKIYLGNNNIMSIESPLPVGRYGINVSYICG